MRWWLAAVFGIIVAGAAITVAQVLTIRSEHAFRDRAKELAAGNAVTAASAITSRAPGQSLALAAALAARQRQVAIFAFDDQGRLLTAPSSHGVAVESVPDLDAVVRDSITGSRSVDSVSDGRRIVVGLPLRDAEAASLVAVASRPDLVAAGNIVRGELARTLLIAVAVGALAGISVAMLIAARLRRIARAAARIQGGDFDEPLEPRFYDELGQLAESVDQMRRTLRDSFASLEAERDRLRDLLEQLQEGVIAIDSSLAVVFANSRAELLLGRRRLDAGSKLPTLWPGVDVHAFAASLFEEGGQAAMFRVSPREGFTFAVAGVPARDSADTALLVITDVTVSVRRERAEREFVANAAHELRTPLSAISSAVDVLQVGAKNDPEDRDRFLGVIERQSQRLARLVGTLLALARAQTHAEPLAMEAVDVASVLAEVSDELPGDLRVETSCEPLLSVHAHRELLVHAVGNLVANAAKHSSGSPIEIDARRAPGSEVRIEVRDRGHGIDDVEHELVFDRFYRGGNRDGEGFGLGLSIVREIAVALGGEIELEPRPGGGTVAAIVIERQQEPE